MRRSVAAIVVSDGKFFVARRPFGGALGMMWEFPGGKVEEGETDEEAIVREFDEEFGAAVVPVRMLGQTEFLHNGRARELAAWLVTLSSNAHLELREHTECRWVGRSEFADLPFADSDRSLLSFLNEL